MRPGKCAVTAAMPNSNHGQRAASSISAWVTKDDRVDAGSHELEDARDGAPAAQDRDAGRGLGEPHHAAGGKAWRAGCETRHRPVFDLSGGRTTY